MQLEVCADADAAAERGAELILEETSAAIAARGRALIAVSGGHTPWAMLRTLTRLGPDWSRIVIFQVDERACPASNDSRNLKRLRENLPKGAHIEPMPVETGEPCALEYTVRLAEMAGEEKRDALHRLLAEDPAIPAGRVRAARRLVIADSAAAGDLST